MTTDATRRRVRVSSRDVAQVAGVSANTVSLVVRDSPLVAPATKARVQEVIAQLGYRPHAAAAALRSTRSRTVGFLVSEVKDAVHDVFRHQLLSAITMHAQAADHYLLVDTFVDAERCVGLLNSGRIDGAVIDWMIPDAVLAVLAARGAPIVVAGRSAGELPVTWVKADEEGGAYQAGRHLLELGHRHLALLAAGEEQVNAVVAARLRGFARALVEGQIPAESVPTAYGDWTFESGLACGRHLLDQQPRPSAIFVLNELMAVGVLRASQAIGLGVPDDLTIVTVEDSPWVEYVQPPLSAVHVPMHDVGACATEALLALLADSTAPARQFVLPTTFTARASSAPAGRR